MRFQSDFNLFCFFSLLKIDEKLFTVNTVEKMQVMYNNYEQDTTINEYVSPNERKEEDEFLEAVLATPVMRFVRRPAAETINFSIYFSSDMP